MNTNALIIFVRKPELGKVKTRLAATMGDKKALSIYKELLQHTYNITYPVDADKFVFYYNETDDNDMWKGDGFNKRLQSNGDLGSKMKDAFAALFNEGYQQVVIIGSDCFELTTAIINDAFVRLEKNDVVIGPSTDRGYYLLGMKQLLSFVFNNKRWSTEHVFEETITELQKEHISYHTLTYLTDVDTEEDWLATKTNP